MSSCNPLGIFASVINGRHNLGYNALKGMTAARAERILSEAIAISAERTGDAPATIEEDLRWRVGNANRVRGITEPMILASIALGEIETVLTTRSASAGAGEMFESAAPIQDSRSGNERAYQVLMASAA